MPAPELTGKCGAIVEDLERGSQTFSRLTGVCGQHMKGPGIKGEGGKERERDREGEWRERETKREGGRER